MLRFLTDPHGYRAQNARILPLDGSMSVLCVESKTSDFQEDCLYSVEDLQGAGYFTDKWSVPSGALFELPG